MFRMKHIILLTGKVYSKMLFFCLLFLRTILATVGAPAVSAGAGSSTGATAAVWKIFQNKNIKLFSPTLTVWHCVVLYLW